MNTEANLAISSGFVKSKGFMLCTGLYVSSPMTSEFALSRQIVARATWAEVSLYKTTVASLVMVLELLKTECVNARLGKCPVFYGMGSPWW